jgi:hypothetical protein
MQHITEQVKWSSAITPTAGAAGTTTINGSILDTAGFDAQACTVRFGAIVTGAVTSIKFQQGAASDMSDAADLEGTGQTIADTDDDGTFIIDITHMTKRYGRVVVSRATQNATVASAQYLQYAKSVEPVTQGAGVTVERFNAPAEGTA